MEVNILESTIVKPANWSEADRRRLWLSNLDLVHARVHMPVLFFYKPDAGGGGGDGFFDTKLLKEALSRALVLFHPLAGRLARDDEGRIEVDCNGEGVLFREAEAPEVRLEDIDEFTQASELLKLVPTVDYAREMSSYYLVLSQVTRFKCKGVCLGISVYHTLGDGQSGGRFIDTWSEMARGLPPTVSPFLDRTILRARNPPSPKFEHPEYVPRQVLIDDSKSSKGGPRKPTTMAILKFAPDLVSALVKRGNPGNNRSGVRYSTYQVLAAHVWRCVSRVRGLADDEPTVLHVPVDGRSRLNPPVPSGYFGNVVFRAAAVAKAGELASEPMARTLERIRRAIDTMDDEYLKSAIDYFQVRGDPATVMNAPRNCPSPIKMISWVRIPFEYVDFGWGSPVSYRPANLIEGKGNLIHNMDGSLSLAICLEADAMVAFQKLVHDADRCYERSP